MGFQQGLSGLNTSAKALDVVGNNIANSNTVGFKTARAEFSDVYAKALSGGGASPVGAGAQVANIAQQFTQGNITSTNNPLDLAINGGGFYMMSENGALTYTRNGQFQLNKDGYIVDSGGRNLQGYQASPTGDIIAASPADIFIDPADIDPQVTAKVTVGLNLDSREDVPAVVFPTAATGAAPNLNNIISPDAYNASTSLSIYDTLGNPHVMTLYFAKTNAVPAGGGAIWNMFANIDGTSAQHVDFGAGPGLPAVISFGTDGLVSDVNGLGKVPLPAASLDMSVGTGVTYELNNTLPNPVPPLVNGAQDTIVFSKELDLTSLTQFGSPFGVSELTQDGFSSGRLAGLSVSPEGIVQGRYTNGQTNNLAQVTLARFTNPNGLVSLGGNQWQETDASGQALVGVPGSGSNGLVKSAAVEEANVDLTAELVNMITLQRSYQANAQTIKTQDSILNTLVNLR